MDRKKIFVCVPSKTGGPRIETTASLLAEISLMTRLNWEWLFRARVGDSYIHRTRNLLVGQFMETDCTEILMVDDDVACRHGDMIRLLSHDADIVGGTYVVKDDVLIRYALSGAHTDADPVTGLIEVVGLPGGFLRIKREAIEKMIDHRRATRLKDEVVDFKDPHAGVRAWNLFDIILTPTGYEGEDYTFCRRAKAAGFKVLLDPELRLMHIGEKTFTGCYADDLRLVKPQSDADKIKHALEAVA